MHAYESHGTQGFRIKATADLVNIFTRLREAHPIKAQGRRARLTRIVFQTDILEGFIFPASITLPAKVVYLLQSLP